MLVPLNLFALETCSNKNSKVGSYLKKNNRNDWELINTTRVNIDSHLKEEVIRALSEAEKVSMIQILRFMETKIKNGKAYHPRKINEGNNLNKLLKQMVTISKCYKPYSYVEVIKEFSTRTINFSDE